MQYVDRHTNLDRIEEDVTPLLSAMLENQQIRYDGQQDPPNVTEAIKYERQRQSRRQTSPYEGDDDFVDSILDIFDFPPLDFQVQSWKTVDALDRARRSEDTSKGAILSAPTGFGKTEAFLGALYQLLREGRQESVAIVYPRRALLQDQLGRILEHVYRMRETLDEQLSVGCYIGKQPWTRSQFGSNSFFEQTEGRHRFKLCNCWCSDDEPHAFEHRGTSKSYVLECEHDSDHHFTDQELILPRKDVVFNDQPDIVLTTLESLENFAHKPHYPLVDDFDTIVLDEVHLNTGLRGAHAAKIIENVDEISEDPLLWLGSSATVDDPERFGRDIFGLSSSDIEVTKPPDSDYDTSHDDHEHYYFMLAPEEGPGVASMAIQQSMLLGHTMLSDPDGARSKQLSFIDSISQINQQSIQFEDADRTDRLWQYHLDDQFGEDWHDVAAEMGQQFITEPLAVQPVYAEEGFDQQRAADSDLLLSTNFLEVGIDVGEIKLVTQYRTPWNLSSFLQRAGRAARKPGMDSHIAVYLSNLTGDANMFYRADRFLGSDIRTPLNTANPVVEWMHNRFNRYYRIIDAIDDEHFRSGQAKHQAFLERYLQDDLGYEPYYRMIAEPAAFFDDAIGLDVSSERLLSKPVLEKLLESLEDFQEERHESVADIESYFGMEGGEIIRGSEAVATYAREVQDQTLEVIDRFEEQVSAFEAHLSTAEDTGSQDLLAAVRGNLESARSDANEIDTDDPSTAVGTLATLVADLFGHTGQLMRLRTQANAATDESVQQVDQSQLTELNEAVTQLETLTEDDQLEAYYDLEKRIHYLESALQEYAAYLDQDTPFNSLYRVKDLLRGAYYFDLYLQTAGDQLDDDVWFVPPDYFGSSGQFFKVFREEEHHDRPEESIDQIVNSYAPYRAEYRSEAGHMHAFLPKTEVTEDGVEMRYSKHVTGEERDGVLVPETLQLEEMRDASGESAQQMVQFCPECFQVIPESSDACPRHGEPEYGKIHSEPHVQTTVTDRDSIDSTGELTLADLEARVSLESVTLEITPGRYYGEEIGVTFDSAADRYTQELESPDPPLGYTTRTRGLVYDMEPFVDGIDDQIQELVQRYKDLEETEIDRLAYHTAAHFLLQFVTDVSSVSTERVFYGFDESVGEIYVFERTEGGQGIVDLVYDELETDPGSALESIYRIMYNEQVINERLWAQAEFVESLPTADTTVDELRPLVETTLDIPAPGVIDRVAEEVISTIDHAHQLAADLDLTSERAYELKHLIAREQIGGVDEFPADAMGADGFDISQLDRVKTAFYSPDIDGCVENLHITECIEAGDQSETLSYVLLEAFRAHLTETVADRDAAATMFEHELPPGGESNGTSVFLDF